eukprot:TRINITY_DN9983_c0_g1_i4.p2 TRINITY_DN9983_c0_g1~~TRINITY_DN9983_c0_g1_i4.p2  ORF type:complete len:274 (+),score=48.97 TRINITY_DN9983_c0_g1_i4:75-896(+)
MVAALPEMMSALVGPKCSLVDSLHAGDLGRWQLANRATKVVLDDGTIWAACVERELPQLVVNPMLFDGSERASVLQCLAYLKRAILASRCVVTVDSAEDVRQLEAILRSASCSADAHRANGGNFARVLVGSFGVAERDSLRSFAFGRGGQPSLGAFPPGRLHVKLQCRDGAHVFVGARYSTFAREAQANADARDVVPFSLDLRSCGSTRAKLSFRGASLRTDGVLRPASNGMCEMNEPVVQPVLSVLTLMDGEPEPEMPVVAGVLHLDFASST